eukprot:TRINITY_DN34595_c0_g1_i1.p1 TRINITY_DN34595_c0_g1~~TRINITY_DN34595_c0_g1_i1.p1  ORF type:complete len:177 (+),score=60.77 TRINITY_DN34595_c0_g1_i1:52-531(+)
MPADAQWLQGIAVAAAAGYVLSFAFAALNELAVNGVVRAVGTAQPAGWRLSLSGHRLIACSLVAAVWAVYGWTGRHSKGGWSAPRALGPCCISLVMVLNALGAGFGGGLAGTAAAAAVPVAACVAATAARMVATENYQWSPDVLCSGVAARAPSTRRDG